FKAEDGIRAFHVTGVQTCALPISTAPPAPSASPSPAAWACRRPDMRWRPEAGLTPSWPEGAFPRRGAGERCSTISVATDISLLRSEERRVGKDDSSGISHCDIEKP